MEVQNKSHVFILTPKQLFDLLVRVYNIGFNQYPMAEAGLEPNEADLIADWTMRGLEKNKYSGDLINKILNDKKE